MWKIALDLLNMKEEFLWIFALILFGCLGKQEELLFEFEVEDFVDFVNLGKLFLEKIGGSVKSRKFVAMFTFSAVEFMQNRKPTHSK